MRTSPGSVSVCSLRARKASMLQSCSSTAGDSISAHHLTILRDILSMPTTISTGSLLPRFLITRYFRLIRVSRSCRRHIPDQASVNDMLWNSPADWISPGYDDEIPNGRWLTNPPENQGRKVVLSDTDH